MFHLVAMRGDFFGDVILRRQNGAPSKVLVDEMRVFPIDAQCGVNDTIRMLPRVCSLREARQLCRCPLWPDAQRGQSALLLENKRECEVVG